MQATTLRSLNAVTPACSTVTPYDWQVNLAEALTLGLDATVVAGTWSGKRYLGRCLNFWGESQ